MTILDFYTDERLDQASRLHLTIPADDPKADEVDVDLVMSFGGKKWYVTEIDQEREGAVSVVKVQAAALWERLAERSYIGSLNLAGVTPASGFDLILENTGWTSGPNTIAQDEETLYSFEGQDQTYLSLLRSWASVCGKIVVFDTATQTAEMVYASSRGVERGFSFRYGRNLTSVKRHVEPPKATRLYAFGRDGVQLASNYIEDYSYYTAQGVALQDAQALYRKDYIYSDNNILEAGALLRAARLQLTRLAQPQVEYTMKVADLSELTGVSEDDVQVGDTVRVRDSVFGWDVRTTVVRLQKYSLEPWRNQVELSYLYDPTDPTGTGGSGRSSGALAWEMFQSRNKYAKIRNAASWTTNRIGLAFSDRAEAVYGYDLYATGVGTGTLGITAYDAENDVLEHAVKSIDYVDGERIHFTWSWSHDSADPDDELNGQRDYRIRIQAVPTGGGGGGASASGVDIEEFDSRFWILARGAIVRTPQLENSIRYDYVSDAVQNFQVPDGVTEITVECVGAKGQGRNDLTNSTLGGAGGRVQAVFTVVPGAEYDVYAPRVWPGGGNGDIVTGGSSGGDGGGYAAVIPQGLSLIDALIVAGGGGGSGESGPGGQAPGGAAGFYEAERKGADTAATQWSGGQGGSVAGPTPGEDGSFGNGGDAGDTTNSFAFAGGGGGAGWYGGGGAAGGVGAGGYAGGGGGGCGYVSEDGREVDFQDEFNGTTSEGDLDGYVVISWETPDI